MTDVLIPKEKLSEGIDSCKDHITEILSDSKKLYESRKFISSIALSILVHEEVGKLNIIRAHHVLKTDITKKEWENLSKPGSHTFKLTTFYGLAIEDLKKMGEEKYNRIVEEEKQRGNKQKFRPYSELLKNESLMRTRFKILNEIKKSCLYLDWKNSEWFNISKIYSEHELELLANYILELAGYEFYSELLAYKYPSDFYHQVSPEVSIMRQDPLWEQREAYTQRVYQDKQYQEFLDAVNYLLETFPKKSFKFV